MKWLKEWRARRIARAIEETEEWLRRNGTDEACRALGRAQLARLRAQQ